MRELLDPRARIFLPALTLSCLIWLLARKAQHRSLGGVLAQLRRLLAYPDTGLDLRLGALGLGLGALLATPLSTLGLSFAVAAARAAEPYWGEAWLAAPSAALFWGFAGALLVVDDATRYALHRALHRLPWLWRVHQVHHSASVMTPLTFYRVHPIEMFLYALRHMVVAGAVSSIFLLVAGGSLRWQELSGLQLILLAAHHALANLRHSHVPMGWPSWLEHLLISPLQHQMHHSRCEIVRNYGSIFSLWDYLGGSLAVSANSAGARDFCLRRFGLCSRRRKRMLDRPCWARYFIPSSGLLPL